MVHVRSSRLTKSRLLANVNARSFSATVGVIMSEAELTPEARDAIRTYMLKFVIPSAVLLTAVSGALGYAVSGLARIDASGEAAKYALAAAGAAAEAKANAAQAAIEAASSQAKALAAASTAEETKTYLLSVKDQLDKVLTGQYEGLAKSLFAIKEFRDSIQTIPQRQIGEINAKFEEIQRVLYDGGEALVSAPGNVCPPGTYAVKVGSVSVSGGAHGFLESVNVACRQLRFNRPK
jgi:hypothetical protein